MDHGAITHKQALTFDVIYVFLLLSVVKLDSLSSFFGTLNNLVIFSFTIPMLASLRFYPNVFSIFTHNATLEPPHALQGISHRQQLIFSLIKPFSHKNS